MNNTLQTALTSEEFNKLIDEAVPYRVKINTELKEEMKDVRKHFIEYMISADPSVRAILKQKDVSKADKKFIREKKKSAGELFGIVKRIVCPNPKAKDPWRIRTLAKAFRILEYASSEDVNYVGKLAGELAEDNLEVSSTKKLSEENSYFSTDNQPYLAELLNDVIRIQSDIFESTDKIKDEIYDEIEDGIRKSKENKCGISKSQFQKIVTGKANKEMFDAEKFEAKKEKLIESESNEIKSKEIVANKVKEF